MTTYRIDAPAKLNIGLKVTGRRRDGYHDLVTVMVPIDLTDHLEIRLLEKKAVQLACEGHDLPEDEGNLVHRAATAFMARSDMDRGVFVKLMKHIPVAAGMGGGSSDAAATLLAMNDMVSKGISRDALADIALRLGADVPFFLDQRPSLARGIGEILDPIRDWPEVWYVIVMPPIRISSAWAYRNLKLELTSGVDDYINKCLKSEPFAIPRTLENDLESAVSAQYPIIGKIKKRMIAAGAMCASMSGSGPSVFGVFSTREEAIKARGELCSQGLGDVFLAGNWKGRSAGHFAGEI